MKNLKANGDNGSQQKIRKNITKEYFCSPNSITVVLGRGRNIAF